MDMVFFILKSEKDDSWMSPYIPKDRIFSTDVYNSTRAIADLSVIIEQNDLKFDAILTFDEHLVLQTSIIAQAFGCIATPIATVIHSSSNKLLFRKKYNMCCSKKLIKPLIKITNTEDLSKIKLSSKSQVIKPLFGNNSYGVKKISSNEDISGLSAYLNQSWSEKQEESYRNFNGVFLIEDYIKGRTFSVDGIVQNQTIHFAGINEFEYGPEPYFFQVGNNIPPNLSKKEMSLCYTQIGKLIKQLQYENTPFHAEIKLNEGKVFVIEIAVRAPGGQIMKGYEQAFGFDFVRQVINLYINKPVRFKHRKNRFVYQKGVFIYKECDIYNITNANPLPKVCEFIKILHKGDKNHYPINAKPVYYYSIAEKTPTARVNKSMKIEKNIVLETR